MIRLLGLVLLSFTISSVLLVPFIDFLFHIKRQKLEKRAAGLMQDQHVVDENTPIHNQLLKGKDLETPVGGGILIILVVVFISLIYQLFFPIQNSREFYILIFTILSFGAIGIFDDLRKIFSSFSGKYHGMRARYLLILQLIFATVVSLLLYNLLGLNNVYIPIFGNIILGFWYIPLAIFAIVGFANAYNVSDGLDGLSTGILLICLFAFLALAHSLLDTTDSTLSLFIGLWIGSLVAYLYFNVFPARIILGDAGAFGFGATLAVVGLLTGKILALAVIGGMYIIIIASSLTQIFFKRFLHRKLFPVAPIHMYLKYIGWEEPKIVMRFWLAECIFAVFGLWLALLSR